MENQKPIVDRQVIVELLSGDEEYVREFAEASVESFTEFKEQFERSLIERDMERLRKAGHKIKPVAQMMKLNNVITMYETSKILLEEDSEKVDIAGLVNSMNSYCNQLLRELKQLQ